MVEDVITAEEWEGLQTQEQETTPDVIPREEFNTGDLNQTKAPDVISMDEWDRQFPISAKKPTQEEQVANIQKEVKDNFDIGMTAALQSIETGVPVEEIEGALRLDKEEFEQREWDNLPAEVKIEAVKNKYPEDRTVKIEQEQIQQDIDFAPISQKLEEIDKEYYNPSQKAAIMAGLYNGMRILPNKVYQDVLGISNEGMASLDKLQKDYPISYGISNVTGEIASLLFVAGILKQAGLASKAAQIGLKYLPKWKYAATVIPRMIQTGGIFGTKTFLKTLSNQIDEENIDIISLGLKTAKDTGIGALLGSIGAVKNVPLSIASAGGLGYTSAKMEGASNQEALLNGFIWSTFELIHGMGFKDGLKNVFKGKQIRLQRELSKQTVNLMADAIQAKNPYMPRSEATQVARDGFLSKMHRFGLNNMDDIAKAPEKKFLGALASLNQKIAGGIKDISPDLRIDVKKPQIELKPSVKPKADLPTIVKTGEKLTYKGADYTIKKTGEGAKPWTVIKLKADGTVDHELDMKSDEYVEKMRVPALAKITRADFNQEQMPLAVKDIKVEQELIDKADQLQNELGKKIVISSGYRTQEYNKDLKKRGYSPDEKSLHLKGRAFDVSLKKSGLTHEEIIKAAEKIGLDVEDISLTPYHAHLELPTEGSPTKLISKIPIFKNDNEAIAYAKTIADQPDKIEAVKAEREALVKQSQNLRAEKKYDEAMAITTGRVNQLQNVLLAAEKKKAPAKPDTLAQEALKYDKVEDFVASQIKEKDQNYIKDTAEGNIKGWLEEDDGLIAVIDSLDAKIQGKGFGKKAVAEFEKWANDKGAKELKVEAEEQAIGFWEKQGLEILQRGDIDTPTTMSKLLEGEKQLTDIYNKAHAEKAPAPVAEKPAEVKSIETKSFASAEPVEPVTPTPKSKKPILNRSQIKRAEKKKAILKKQLEIQSAEEAKKEVTKMVRSRRYYLNEKSYDTNLFINNIEQITTKKQREIIPFLIEKTDIPKELGRKDLEDVYKTDKKNLQTITKQIKKHFDEGWEYLQKNVDNLSAKQIEDYITHIWDIPKDKKPAITNWFTTKNRFLKRRFIETYKKGIQEFGLKPKTLDVSDIIRIHDAVMHKAIANKNFVDALNDMKVEGVPVIERSDKAPKDWVLIDHPSLRKGLVIPGDLKRGEKVSVELNSILTEMGVAIGRRISPVVFGKPSLKAGEYIGGDKKFSPEIRLQRFFESSTVAHEIGHHIDTSLGLGKEFVDTYKDEIYALNRDRIDRLKGRMPKSWNKGGVEYAETPEEQIAELFAHLFTKPEKAFKLAPNASYEALERLKTDEALTKLVDFDFENKAKDLIEEQLNTMVKLPVKVHPDLAKPLKVIFDSRINHPIVQGIEMVNGYLKKTRLSLSLFHHMALGETSVATIGPVKTLGIYANVPKMWKALVKNQYDVFKNEPLARDAISHGVSLGATADIPVAKIQKQLNELAAKTKNIPFINKTTEFVRTFNETWDKFLWDYLHDNLKLYGYESLVSKMTPTVNPEQMELLKQEIGQFVNDTYGGQNWDILMVNPKTIQIASLALLSPDWTVSTVRQGMSATGVGALNKEMKKARFRMGINFWIKAMMYFGMGINALNHMFKKWDEKENPEFYKDQDQSFWDRTMLGNTIGHKTHLFVGRYENGQERYIRWGKQFREVPELLFDDTGFSPASATLRKIGGKVSPAVDTVSKTFTGVSPSGFKSRNIVDEKGWKRVLGITEELIKSPIPYSMRSVFQENKEFHLTDLAFPSSKGMSRYKAMDLFKTAIKAKDLQLLKETWHGAMINNLPPESLYKAALTSLKAENTIEKNRNIKSIEEGKQKFKEAIDPINKRIYHRKIKKLYKEKRDWENGLRNLDLAIKKLEKE